MGYSKGMRRCLFCLTLVVGAPGVVCSQAFVEPEKSDSSEVTTPVPAKLDSSRSTVNWNGLVWQSSFFLGIQHGFRLATEAGTREMKGPFFQGYANSLGNIHGWSDGDPFYVNYIGHPIQGAVGGFIWTRNDKLAQGVEFGKDRRYWKSRLRAAAWTFAYSAQFELGPVSEASIGYIQNSYPQQGLVDLVITPTIGMGWLITEDALDRYLVIPFENKFSNRYARIMVRAWLNPARSFANAMAFKLPWHRDDRPGVGQYTAALRATRPKAQKTPTEYPLVAPFEFTMNANGRLFAGSSQSCAGAGATSAFRVAPAWQIVLDVNGCNLLGMGNPYLSGDYLSYVIGPRWAPMAAKRWSPYAEILVGGNKITNELVDPVKRAAFEADAHNLEGRRPPSAEFAEFKEKNAFMISAATGVDLRLTRALAVRVASLGYTHSWVGTINGVNYSNGLQFSSGLVLRMGTW
jgi:hypothetical protein